MQYSIPGDINTFSDHVLPGRVWKGVEANAVRFSAGENNFAVEECCSCSPPVIPRL